jgi:hypothetical protein
MSASDDAKIRNPAGRRDEPRTQPDAAAPSAGGVRWIGVDRGTAVVEHGARCERAGSSRDIVVFGSSHGARLLERLGSSAAI